MHRTAITGAALLALAAFDGRAWSSEQPIRRRRSTGLPALVVREGALTML